MRHTLIYIITALTLAACTSTDEPALPAVPSTDDEPLTEYVSMGLRINEGKALAWQPETKSRDVKPPLEATYPDVIGVYGYNNIVEGLSYTDGIGEIFANTPMVYRDTPYYDNLIGRFDIDATPFDQDDLWLYKNPVPWRRDAKYLFFAYSPATDYTAGQTEESVEAQTATFDGFDRFIWHSISQYSITDHMISDKIVTYTSKADGSANPHQWIYMTHLQARLRFCFKLGPEFSKLRIIHLKRMAIEELSGRTLTVRADYLRTSTTRALATEGYELKEAKWTYDSDLSNHEYSKQLANDRDPVTNDHIEYIELSGEASQAYNFQPLASAYVFTGDRLGKIKIRVWYDVFDLDGQLLRSDDQATNILDLTSFEADSYSGSMSGKRKLIPGYYYDVNIIVEPTFLYVLSDNDPSIDGAMLLTP